MTFKLSLKGKETKIRKEEPKVTYSVALIMRDSQTEDDLRIRDFTTVDESTKVFRLEATKKSHSMGETFC